MGGTAKMNAMRSGLIVLGAGAFGYLTLQLGFKPFLEKAELDHHRYEAFIAAQSAASETQDSFGESLQFAGDALSDGLPDSARKL